MLCLIMLISKEFYLLPNKIASNFSKEKVICQKLMIKSKQKYLVNINMLLEVEVLDKFNKHKEIVIKIIA